MKGSSDKPRIAKLMIARQHLHEAAHHARRRIELPAILSLGAGKARQEILVDPAQQVDGPMSLFTLARGGEFNRRDDVYQLNQSMLVETGARIVLGQRSLETRVVALQCNHGIVHTLADRWLLRVRLHVRPARVGGHTEDVRGPVFIRVFGIRAVVVTFAGEELSAMLFEVSEMYLRKMRPSTTCLYSAASMLLRRLSAVCHSSAYCGGGLG
jgi:hypothetical protein